MKKKNILTKFYIREQIKYEDFNFILLKINFFLKLSEVLIKIQKHKIDNNNIKMLIPTISYTRSNKIYQKPMYKNIILLCIRKNDLYKQNYKLMQEKTKKFGQFLSKDLEVEKIKNMFKYSLSNKTNNNINTISKDYINFKKQHIDAVKAKLKQKLKDKNMVVIKDGLLSNRIGKILEKKDTKYLLRVKIFRNKLVNVWVDVKDIQTNEVI